MKPRQLPWKWLLVGLAVVLVAGLALLLPRQLGTPSDLRDRVVASLSDWTGGTVTLTEPLRVSYFPPSLRGGFVLSNATKLPAVDTIAAPDFRATLDLSELLMGRTKLNALRLGKPTITVKDNAGAGQEPFAGLVAAALINPPVEAVRIRRGKINWASGQRLVGKLDIRLNARGRSGVFEALGSFGFNGETVVFAVDSGKIAETENGKAAPVTLKVTSDPVTARFSGTVHAADRLEGDGTMEASLPDARRFLNWVGVPLPKGESLKNAAASGSVHWSGSTLTFDDGTFELDGNEAVGLFSLTAQARPRIEGTLAFETLTLDPYLGTGEAALEERPFAWALLKHLDADLRISAGGMSAAGLELGRGGFTINAKGGAISGEVGELDLCGGQAAGRLGLDLSGTRSKASLVGTLTNIAVDTCLKPFALALPLAGRGTLKLDVSTGGTTRSELVRGLAGQVKVTARDGAVPINFPGLAARAGINEEGWSRDTGTVFKSLNADCSLSAGHLWCQSFRMQTPRGIISGSGGVDVAQQTLDWDFLIADPVAPLDASQLVMETPPRVTVHGSLAEPLIQRANRPTLGDGSPKIDPESTSAAPR
jgi:AsmA protein